MSNDTKVLRLFSSSDRSDYCYTEAVDIGPTGVRSKPYWYVHERGIRLGRRFHTLDTAKEYVRRRPNA